MPTSPYSRDRLRSGGNNPIASPPKTNKLDETIKVAEQHASAVGGLISEVRTQRRQIEILEARIRGRNSASAAEKQLALELNTELRLVAGRNQEATRNLIAAQAERDEMAEALIRTRHEKQVHAIALAAAFKLSPTLYETTTLERIVQLTENRLAVRVGQTSSDGNTSPTTEVFQLLRGGNMAHVADVEATLDHYTSNDSLEESLGVDDKESVWTPDRQLLQSFEDAMLFTPPTTPRMRQPDREAKRGTEEQGFYRYIKIER